MTKTFNHWSKYLNYDVGFVVEGHMYGWQKIACMSYSGTTTEFGELCHMPCPSTETQYGPGKALVLMEDLL